VLKFCSKCNVAIFRVLSRNEIREIVMDSDSDEDKYYASEGSEDEEEPLEDNWTKMEQLCTPFYGQRMARSR